MISDLFKDEFLTEDNLKKLRQSTKSEISENSHGHAHYSTSKPQSWINGQFLRGPISMAWLERAAKLKGKAPLAIALVLQFESGRQNEAKSVKLTNDLAKKLNVSRKSKYTALKALEEAGLISVKQEIKKSPIVTILDESS